MECIDLSVLEAGSRGLGDCKEGFGCGPQRQSGSSRLLAKTEFLHRGAEWRGLSLEGSGTLHILTAAFGAGARLADSRSIRGGRPNLGFFC